MSQKLEIVVPDIGDFDAVPIIEILVQPGDTVEIEDGLITLESDKATMDIPSPAAGIIESIRVAIGDEVAQGSIVGTLLLNDKADSDNSDQTEAAKLLGITERHLRSRMQKIGIINTKR